MPSFSVVITNYNYGAFVAEAVESALAQTAPPLEVIVVDDGSSDGSAAHLAQRYGTHPSVRIIATENRGQLAAFGEGVRSASGEVVAFLDADDLWQPRYLATLGAAYEGQKGVDFVFTNMEFFGSREGVFLKAAVNRNLGLSILLGAYHTRWQASATSAISLHRKLALALLDLPQAMLQSWRTRADDCLACGADILGAHKLYLAEPLVRYRAHGENAWLNQSRQPEHALRHWLRVEAMLEHYRQMVGLNTANRAAHLRHVKHEFRTKPKPSREELAAYLTMLGQSSLTFWQRLEHRVAMWWHYRKHR